MCFAKTPAAFGINDVAAVVFTSVLVTLVRLFYSQKSLLPKNQQLFVLKRRHPRPRLDLSFCVDFFELPAVWTGAKAVPNASTT